MENKDNKKYEQKETTILHLDDYCLIEICKFLYSQDLFSLFVAHSHFNNAIDFVMAKRRKEVCLTREMISSKRIEKFFEMSGSKIKDITINCGLSEYTERVENLITNYCSTGNIKKCYFPFDFTIRDEFVQNNLIFFKSLKCLTVHSIMDSTALENILDIINQVKELTLHDSGDDDEPINILTKILAIPLHKLAIDWGYMHIPENYVAVLPINITLKHFESYNFYAFSILNHFKNLESLKLTYKRFGGGSIYNFCVNMKNLKKLVVFIDCLWTNYLHVFLSSLIESCYDNLEELKLCIIDKDDGDCGGSVNRTEILNMLFCLRNLKVLHLSADSSYVNYLLELVKNLEKLCELELIESRFVREDRKPDDISFFNQLYEEMAVVRKRQNAENKLHVGITNYKDRRYVGTRYNSSKWVEILLK